MRSPAEPVAARAPIVSVELLLDPAAESAIRAEWDALAAAGLSSAGAHPGASNRPHLSLAVRTGLGDPEALSGLAAGLPLPLTLAGLVLFPHGDRVVLARAIAPSSGLVALHAGVAEAVAGWGDPLPHTLPGGWTPHVTLARRLRRDELPRALELLELPDLPAPGTALRVWDAATRRVHPVG